MVVLQPPQEEASPQEEFLYPLYNISKNEVERGVFEGFVETTKSPQSVSGSVQIKSHSPPHLILGIRREQVVLTVI